MTVSKPTRKQYVEALKGAFISRAKKRAVSKISAKLVAANLGFLAAGPFGIILTMVVDKIITEAIDDAETLIFFKYVDLRVAHQSDTFTEEALEFEKIKQTGTKEQIDAAEKKMLEAFDHFIKFNSI